eukprot:PhF_6_TR27938/c1_g1_i2/m.41165
MSIDFTNLKIRFLEKKYADILTPISFSVKFGRSLMLMGEDKDQLILSVNVRPTRLLISPAVVEDVFGAITPYLVIFTNPTGRKTPPAFSYDLSVVGPWVPGVQEQPPAETRRCFMTTGNSWSLYLTKPNDEVIITLGRRSRISEFNEATQSITLVVPQGGTDSESLHIRIHGKKSVLEPMAEAIWEKIASSPMTGVTEDLMNLIDEKNNKTENTATTTVSTDASASSSEDPPPKLSIRVVLERFAVAVTH